MSFSGGNGGLSAIYRPTADVPTLQTPTASMRFVATGALTGGEFGLFLREMAPHAGGPEAHFHRTFSESFYVLEGTVKFFNGEHWVDGTAGDFLYVPRGGIHAFRNDSDATASMVMIFAPGSREQFFKEAAEIRASGRELTPQEWTDFYARHDQYMV